MPIRGKRTAVARASEVLGVLTPAQVKVWNALGQRSRSWNAYLAGGAALALRLNHRRSNDFDWFTPNRVAPSTILSDVKSSGLHLDELKQNDEGTFHAIVSGTEVSLFRYPYRMLEPPTPWLGGQLASILDIAAMKIAALRQRSSKRDFVDLHALITGTSYTLEDMLIAFGRKYQVRPIEALKAMTYFGPVENQKMPIMIKEVKWSEIKAVIELAVSTLDRGRLQSIPPRQ